MSGGVSEESGFLSLESILGVCYVLIWCEAWWCLVFFGCFLCWVGVVGIVEIVVLFNRIVIMSGID